MTPRIAPVAKEDGEGLMDLNIFRTLANHPKLYDRFGRFGGYLLFRGLLPAREREIVILRVGWRSQSIYEFGQHTRIGIESGMTEDEIKRVATDSLDGWSDADRDLVAFSDELCATNNVTDETWARLAARWSDAEMIELLVVAGFYRLVSGFLNATGVEREPGVAGWP